MMVILTLSAYVCDSATTQRNYALLRRHYGNVTALLPFRRLSIPAVLGVNESAHTNFRIGSNPDVSNNNAQLNFDEPTNNRGSRIVGSVLVPYRIAATIR